LIAEDFHEFGVSGTIGTAPTIIEALRGESFFEREISDFRLTMLADDVALVTCRSHRFVTAERPGADSLHSSTRRRGDGAWKRLHGTVLPE
jgi:glyoxylase I family protein